MINMFDIEDQFLRSLLPQTSHVTEKGKDKVGDFSHGNKMLMELDPVDIKKRWSRSDRMGALGFEPRSAGLS